MTIHHHVEPPNVDEWPTCVRLALALEFAGAPAFMVATARYGGYHDYLTSVAAPEALLLEHARRYKLPTIVEGVLEGRFDATREESDRWAASAEGQQVLGSIVAQPKSRSMDRTWRRNLRSEMISRRN